MNFCLQHLSPTSHWCYTARFSTSNSEAVEDVKLILTPTMWNPKYGFTFKALPHLSPSAILHIHENSLGQLPLVHCMCYCYFFNGALMHLQSALALHSRPQCTHIGQEQFLLCWGPIKVNKLQKCSTPQCMIKHVVEHGVNGALL